MTKTLLAILAHPDDESYGPGGTLARYVDEGVDVHICIATDGAAGSVAEGHEDARDNLVEVRKGELDRAIAILGATLHKLNYRDSGMTGDPANTHPDAWVQSDDNEAIGRVVELIRRLKPDVLLTHNETGDYFHPDHIRCHEVTMAAFKAAADASQYPELELPPHQVSRVYNTAFSNRWVKVVVVLARLRGADPTKFGRNKDIDMTKLGIDPSRINTRVNYRAYWDVKRRASAQHASQGGGGSRFRMIPEPIQRRILSKDTFIRVFPPVSKGHRETSFFD